tara:strand:+ start:1036 stop:1266 length:231 start_codon:yes stop_codon:yes gene_type:complete
MSTLSIIYEKIEAIKKQENANLDEEHHVISCLSNQLDKCEKEQLMRYLDKIQYDERLRKMVYKLAEHLFKILKDNE